MVFEQADTLLGIHQGHTVDEFAVLERIFSPNPELPSVGLANIHAVVPDIEGNKDKIVRATQVFKEHKANIAIFPEFALSGYFWEDEASCRAYMDQALTENHYDWIDNSLVPLLDDNLRAIVLNNLTRGPGDFYYNTTMVISERKDYRSPAARYNKVFLPGIEQLYTVSGKDDRLVAGTKFGTVGFTTCYDYLFVELLREYSFLDRVDAIIEIASWRALAARDYPTMNVRSEYYYGALWDVTMAANSAMNQVWTIACNAVGRHEITDAVFWGGSGVWAPSGMKLVQASHINEELLIVHNLDLLGERQNELDDFNYGFDFSTVYRQMDDQRVFTRID